MTKEEAKKLIVEGAPYRYTSPMSQEMWEAFVSIYRDYGLTDNDVLTVVKANEIADKIRREDVRTTR